MNFQGIIDFNKYTLALAAACFAYAVEKFAPVTDSKETLLLLSLLAILLASVITGIAIFAAATAAMNAEAGGQTARINKTKKFLSATGTTHSLLLSSGMLLMGYMLYGQITTPKKPPAALACCCSENRPAPNERLQPTAQTPRGD